MAGRTGDVAASAASCGCGRDPGVSECTVQQWVGRDPGGKMVAFVVLHWMFNCYSTDGTSDIITAHRD